MNPLREVGVALFLAMGAGLGCIDARAIHVRMNSDGGDGASGAVADAADRSAGGDTGESLPAFLAPIYYPAGVDPIAVALGDLNSDGRVDVAVANHGSGQPSAAGSVSVLFNLGTGMLAPATDYAAGVSPRFLAIGDVNADGRLDLVVANDGDAALAQVGDVSVLLNLGGQGASEPGVFASAVHYATGGSPRSLAVEDLDEDGWRDIVVANDGKDGAEMDVLRNQGRGTFAAPIRFAVTPSALSVAIGRLNPSQGVLPDIVAATGNGVSVFLNQGSSMAMFSDRTIYSIGAPAYAVALSDLNGDGSLDAAVASNASGSNGGSGASAPGAADVGVLMNNGNGTFADPLRYGSHGQANSIALADLNLDEKIDVILAHGGDQTAGSAPGISVLLNRGGGTFASTLMQTIAGHPSSVAIGDLDADGWPDVAVANGEAVVLLLTTGEPGPGATGGASGRGTGSNSGGPLPQNTP